MARRKKFYVDVDSTDDFLDDPEPRYRGGRTLREGLEADGYDTRDLGTLAEQIRQRGGKVPTVPPSPDT